MRRAAAMSSAIAGAWSVLVSVTAAAQPESLERAWQLAVERDSGLAAVAADVDTARAQERAAVAERRPSVTATAGHTRFHTAPRLELVASDLAFQAPIFDDDAYTSASVQVTLPLYTGGGTAASIDAARRMALGAQDAHRAARASLRLTVAESYVDVLRAQRLERNAAASVASLSAHVADIEEMVRGELAARSDLLAARVALADAEQQRVRAENGVAVAYAAYNRRLGEPLDRIPDLEDRIPVDDSLAAEPIEALVRRAFDGRPEIAASAAQAEALAHRSEAERAARLPQLELAGGYTYFENELLDRQEFASVALNVRWNLFDGGRTRSRSAALDSASRAARHRTDDLRVGFEQEVRTAWLDTREARARMSTAREAVAQADENVRITRELYGAGLGTNTEVLDAVALQVAAANNRDNAALDESLALLRLAHAAGTL